MRKQVSFALALSMVMTSGMATVANAAADDGKTNVVFWNSWTGGDGDTLEALVNKFNEESDTVHVEMTRTTSFGDMLQTSLPTGEAADLVLLSTNEITRYKSYLRSMDDIWENTGLKEEDFSPAYLSMCYNDDTLYAIPFQISTYMMYYNKDLFDKAGVEYPSADMTWDEYEALAKKMTSGEGSEKVYGSHNHTWQALVANWAVQDGKNTLMSEDYSFLKPYYEQALRMQDEGVVQSYANLKTGSIHYISVFEQQQCAMLPMGSWFIGTLIQDKEAGKYDFNWGVTTIPHPADTQAGATVGSTTPVAINAKTDVPDLAWEYVKFVTGEEGAMVLADNGIFPAAESDEISSKLAAIPGFPEDGQAALKTTSWVLDRPLDAKMAAVRKVLEEEHDLIMIGEEDVDTGIANMNQRAQEARED